MKSFIKLRKKIKKTTKKKIDKKVKEEKEDIKKLIEGDDALIHSRSVFETGMSGENVVENNDVASFNDVQNMDTDVPSDGGFVPGDFESDDGQDS